MRFKWLTPVLIIVGGVLLLFSIGLDKELSKQETVWFKVVGIILLMIGIYRASLGVKSNQNTEK